MAPSIDAQLKAIRLAKKYHVELVNGDSNQLLFCIPGPDGSAYAGVETWWQFVLPPAYPNMSPALYAVSKRDSLPHPNLFSIAEAFGAQRLCLKELRDWPAGGLALNEIIKIILKVLAEPCWDDNNSPNLTAGLLKGKVDEWWAKQQQ